jgi:phasin family protein
MVSKVQKFVNEQRQALADQVEKLRIQPVASARDAAIRSAQRIKAFKDYIRDIARSGVRLTAISQSTAQSLIELQAEIVTSALTEAATQLERAARTESVVDLVRDQGEVLRATRDRIVSDMRQAVGIFKTTGGDIRKVATQTYAKVSGKGAVPAAKKTSRARKAKRPARKKAARARKAAA